MNVSRHILLSLALLGLPVGLTAAADPEPQLPKGPAVSAPVGGFPTADSSPAVLLPQGCLPGNECCPPPDTPADRSGFIGGAGLYLIQPYFDNNMAFALQSTAGRAGGAIPPGSPGIRADTRVEISHHVEVAPLVWLGYLGEDGLGVRARWWYFRQGTDQSMTVPTGQGANGTTLFSAAPLGLSLSSAEAMAVTSKLELQVADFEALYDLQACGWDLLLAGGVRVAKIDQTYNAFAPEPFMNALFSSHDFMGAGPTLAVEARRGLGLTGLSLYASGRGSLVLGSADQVATIPDQRLTAQDHRNPAIAIGEVELGIAYGRNLGWSRLFGQVALVGQEWFGAGGASRSSVNVLPGGGFNGAAYTGDSNLAFLGLSIRLGVNY